MRFTASIATGVLLPLSGVLAAPQVHHAPLLVPRGTNITDKYIVKMKSGFNITVGTDSIAAKAEHVFSRLGGFSAKLSAKELQTLRQHPAVEYVEQDAEIKLFEVQSNAPWGLARLSSTAPGASDYVYDGTAGEGTCAYVIDSGIDASHPDFGGRAVFAENFIDNDDTDGNGHGTHVAGTIGSNSWGVAKKTKLFGVKVLNSKGSGTNSAIIAGMEYVTTHAANQSCPNGVVVNMSVGGTRSVSVNSAAAQLVSAGFFLSVAAGNGDEDGDPMDAGRVSPASSTSACTVGATDSNDQVASFSNYGEAVDIHAPGVDIESTVPGGGTDTYSGTSMASPHIAGLVAYLLGINATTADAACGYIVEHALDGVITDLQSGTSNKLAQNDMAAAQDGQTTSGAVSQRAVLGNGVFAAASVAIILAMF